MDFKDLRTTIGLSENFSDEAASEYTNSSKKYMRGFLKDRQQWMSCLIVPKDDFVKVQMNGHFFLDEIESNLYLMGQSIRQEVKPSRSNYAWRMA